MRSLVALLVAFAVLASAGTAAAQAPLPPPFPTEAPTSTPFLRESLRIAHKFWKANPCPGGTTFIIAALEATGDTPDGQAPGERVWADHPCAIVLPPAIAMRYPGPRSYDADVRQCNYIGHAVGHELDHDHVDDPRNIMHASPSATIPGCLKRWRPKRVTIRQDRANYERIFAIRPPAKLATA